MLGNCSSDGGFQDPEMDTLIPLLVTSVGVGITSIDSGSQTSVGSENVVQSLLKLTAVANVVRGLLSAFGR